jgi:hypothetical protein
MGARSEQWTVRRRRYYGVCEGELDKGSLLQEEDWKINKEEKKGVSCWSENYTKKIFSYDPLVRARQ